MIVYKAFKPGLICGNYHYKPGEINHEAEANCVCNGIHAAENPADCLSYYAWNGQNEFWKCKAVGDIDEDNMDSKISTTELIPIRRLSLLEYLGECALYILRYPTRIEERYGKIMICQSIGKQSKDCIAMIVAGEAPEAEVTQPMNTVILVDTKKGIMRGGANLTPGWYHITEEGVTPWTDKPNESC